MKRITAIAMIVLLLVSGAFAANTAKQVDYFLSGALKADGSANAGGKVYTCDAGTVCGPSTSDPKTTWQDSGKVSAHANPIILDSNGKKTVFADGIYKFQIYDSDDTLVETLDNLEYTYTGASDRTVCTLTSVTNTVASNCDSVYCDTTSAAIVTDMSGISAVGNSGKQIYFKKIASANSCTIDPTGSQTIDGASTVVLYHNKSDITIESNGTNWYEHESEINTQPAYFYNTVTIANALSASGTTTLSGTNTFSGATTLSSTTTLSGTTTVSGSMTVSGTSAFNNSATFTNTAGFYNAATFYNTATFENAVTFNQAVTFNNTTAFHNSATFDSGKLLTNTVSEETAGYGVNVDGFLIKDGGPDASVWPSFCANISSAQNNITGYDKIEFNKEIFDTNNNYDPTSNYRFTPTVSGKYMFTIQVVWSANVKDDTLHLYLYKNGAQETFTTIYNATNTTVVMPFNPLIVNANGSTDYFEVYARNYNRDTSDLFVSARQYFCGTKVAH